MLSKRAKDIVYKLRFEEEVVFIPSTKTDMVKTVFVFLREVKQPDYPFQITICLNDMSLGRLGYYDLSYKNVETAKKEYNSIIKAIKAVREEVEYIQMSCIDIERMCRKAIDAVLEYAVMFDSTYHGKYRGRTPY